MSIREQVRQFLKQSSFQRYADELAELLKPTIRITPHADLSNHTFPNRRSRC